MSAFTLSPNMSLPVPTVGQEPGPLYAYDVNDSLTLIDGHDHSPGYGVQITPAGININTTLSFNDNPASALSEASFTAQSVATSTLSSISVAPGSADPLIDDLWYTDSNGTKIQLTQSGAIVPGSATVLGINYLAGTFSFTQAQSSLPLTPANLASGSITIRPNVASTTNGVTLDSSGVNTAYSLIFPASLVNGSSLTLPTVPSNSSFLTINTSGVISGSIQTNQGITDSNIANNTITYAKFAAAVTATQADQETATSTTTIVTPGRQQYHPSASKVWITIDTVGGTIQASYNVASIVKVGTGHFKINYSVPFSSTNYAVVGTAEWDGAGVSTTGVVQAVTGTKLVGSVEVVINTIVGAGGTADATSLSVCCFGDL